MHPTMRESTRCPRTKASPSRISSRSRRPGARASGLGSVRRMAAVAPAETRNDTASTTTAAAAPMTATSAPATAGPATWPNDWLAPILPLASISSSGSTSAGR